MYLKSGLIRGVASLEGDNLVVFYYLSVSEIWPYKRGGLSGGGQLVVFYYLSATASEIWSEKRGGLLREILLCSYF